MIHYNHAMFDSYKSQYKNVSLGQSKNVGFPT